MSDTGQPADDAGLQALIDRLASGPPTGHADWTQGALQWAAEGLPGLPALLPLLTHAEPLVRLRAQRVLERASRDWVAQRVVERPLARRVDTAWAYLWAHNGSYDWQGDEANRAASVERWRQWLVTPQLPAAPG
ncbi:hypothetical protein Lcho_3056 [Leptothrix cholodnii SP-6]|uniref:Uncharacterized protein n=1 Tax=Leptothrix cholodnii (strain ATCC 51168 / LMG 8142 / SP-6) TaxID=395495 RepID=B1Y035_LEPCP|nr:hypothetical protein [Leptothrix cholodnii]ACB35316.1 hypothetical protein Lcho_3056 [Leptothrix cholodnii SP-6]